MSDTTSAGADASSGLRAPAEPEPSASRLVAAASQELDDAHEALENAEGALQVAEARAREEAENPDLAEWEKLASAEAARAAHRKRRRCVDAVIRADDAVAAAEATVAGLQAAESGGDEQDDDQERHYANVYVFVETFLVAIHARYYQPNAPWRWCARWWEHPEAIARLEALWQAFEALRRDPSGTGPATWWRDHVDPTMAALTDSSGPFAQCKAGRDPVHDMPSPLPIDLAPAALSAPENYADRHRAWVEISD